MPGKLQGRGELIERACATQPLMAYDLPDVLESTSWMVPVKPLYLSQCPARQSLHSD